MKVIFIVGPQGSGKTTLARLIADTNSSRIYSSLHFDYWGQLTLKFDEKIDHDTIIDECPENLRWESIVKSLPSNNDHKIILCFQKLPVDFTSLHYEPRPIIISLTKPASADQYREMFNCDISQMVGVKAEFLEPIFSPVNNPLEGEIPSFPCFTKKKEHSKGYEILSSLDCISSSALDSLRIGISCLSFISAISMGNGPLDKSILILQNVLKSLSDAKNSLNPDSNEQPKKSV